MESQRLKVMEDNTNALAGVFERLALIEKGEITQPPPNQNWESLSEWKEHLILLAGSYVNIIHSNWKRIPELGQFI